MNGKKAASRTPAHFERLYRASPDPWNMAASDYEQRKYDATLAALVGRRFAFGLEVGCSIGVLTERLAGQCDRLLGVDFIPEAVAAARARCAACAGVSIELMRIPQEWPAQKFDLIVFSEVLYFLADADLRLAGVHAMRSLRPDGQVLLVNYTGETDDPQSGDTAAELFIEATASRLRPALQRREARYRLDLLASRSGI